MSNRIEYIAAPLDQDNRANVVIPTTQIISGTTLSLLDYGVGASPSKYGRFKMTGDLNLLNTIKGTLAFILLNSNGNVISCLEKKEVSSSIRSTLEFLISGNPLPIQSLPAHCTLTVSGTSLINPG